MMGSPTPMVLGEVGHHDSVYVINGGESLKSTNIMNSCLSVIQCYRSSKDKHFIRDKVCSMFTFEQLKSARELLFKTCSPKEKYSYRGPQINSSTEKERSYDAFDGIFMKMVKLDADDTMPKFSVPSEDLMQLLVLGDTEHTACDSKFQASDAKYERLAEEIKELKATFHSFVSIATSNTGIPSVKNTIPPETRKRLLSTASKRSASELSVSDDESAKETTDDQTFEIPRHHRKKLSALSKKAKMSPGKPQPITYSGVLSSKPKEKPRTTWGTIKSATSLKGAVPEIFLHNLDMEVTKEDVNGHFQGQNISLRDVVKLSHKEAARSSFKLSPVTKDDYDKILSGDVLPEGVGARQYIPPRRNNFINKSDQANNQASSGNMLTVSRLNEALRQIDMISHSEKDFSKPTSSWI